MMLNLRWILMVLVVVMSVHTPLARASAKNTSGGFLDFNLYPYLSDVDSDNVFTLNIAAQLDHGFSYFSLLNLSSQEQSSELEDTTSFYTEQNVRWKWGDFPIDLTAQFNFRSGENNDRHRLGFRWRLNDTPMLAETFHSMNLSWSINFHLYQYDDVEPHVWQIEHGFWLSMPYLSDRLYIAGFIDHTFNEDLPDGFPKNPIVAEAQLGYRLVEQLYVVAEYRINEYRRSDVNNVALGFEYKMLW